MLESMYVRVVRLLAARVWLPMPDTRTKYLVPALRHG